MLPVFSLHGDNALVHVRIAADCDVGSKFIFGGDCEQVNCLMTKLRGGGTSWWVTSTLYLWRFFFMSSIRLLRLDRVETTLLEPTCSSTGESILSNISLELYERLWSFRFYFLNYLGNLCLFSIFICAIFGTFSIWRLSFMMLRDRNNGIKPIAPTQFFLMKDIFIFLMALYGLLHAYLIILWGVWWLEIT